MTATINETYFRRQEKNTLTMCPQLFGTCHCLTYRPPTKAMARAK